MLICSQKPHYSYTRTHLLYMPQVHQQNNVKREKEMQSRENTCIYVYIYNNNSGIFLLLFASLAHTFLFANRRNNNNFHVFHENSVALFCSQQLRVV